MKLNIYATYDIKAEAHGTPFFMANDDLARRALGNVGRNPDTTIALNPEDFRLHRIGSFDDNSGLITPEDKPVFVANATECVRAELTIISQNTEEN